MSFIEYGSNRLRKLASILFGPASGTERGEPSHVIPFDTGKGRPPFEVSFSLHQLPPSWGDDAWRIIVKTNNARHPYDENAEFGYFGKEIMNPALLAALNHVESVLNEGVSDGISKLKIRDSVCDLGHKGQDPRVIDSMDGCELWVTVNDEQPGRNKPKAAYAQIAGLYDHLILAVEAARPAIQKHITQSAVLQPHPKPSKETLLLFDAQITGLMTDAISQATGYSGSTVFQLPDGTKRNLIKGLDT